MQNTRGEEVPRSWAHARLFNCFLDNYRCIASLLFHPSLSPLHVSSADNPTVRYRFIVAGDRPSDTKLTTGFSRDVPINLGKFLSPGFVGSLRKCQKKEAA